MRSPIERFVFFSADSVEILRGYGRGLAAALLGIVLGLSLTAVSLRSGYGFGSVRAGPWTIWPQLGASDIDPYAKAAVARRGEAPLGRDEGLMFVASVDSSGAPLEGRCDYRISDPVPPARIWTLELAEPNGAPLANPTKRHHFTSNEILRRDGGGFEIAVARNARAGNWLSPGEAKSFIVALRLYDASLDLAAKLDRGRFPTIQKLACS